MHAPLRPCATPRCEALVAKGHCPKHTKARDYARGTAQARGFTYQWSLFSKAWLVRFPFCGMRRDAFLHAEHSRCVQEGRRVLAECTDHIDGHDRPDDSATFFDEDRLQSLCLRCNNRKRALFEGGFGRSPKADVA